MATTPLETWLAENRPDASAAWTDAQQKSLMDLYGTAYQPEYTPAEQFRMFAGGARPYMRRDLWNAFDPLAARFALRQIGGGLDSPYQPNLGQTFGGFLGGYTPSPAGAYGPGFAPMGQAEMLARASEAARMGSLTPVQLQAQLAGGRGAETLAGYYTYGLSPQAAQNQLQLATAIAQSGQGYGGYTGGVNRAIAGAMQDVFAARQAMGNPETDFLSWYLNALGQAPAPAAATGAGNTAGYSPGSSASGAITPGSDAWSA